MKRSKTPLLLLLFLLIVMPKGFAQDYPKFFEYAGTVGSISTHDANVFPDEQFRAMMDYPDADKNGSLSYEEVKSYAQKTVFDCSGRAIVSLQGIEIFEEIPYLDCSNNSITQLDLTYNTYLTRVDCYGNQMDETSIAALINSLPVVEDGMLVIVDSQSPNEGNHCLSTQVALAATRGWTVYDYKGGGGLATYAGADLVAFGGGSGTYADPYLIYNTNHFDQLAAEVNSGNSYNNDVYFKLMADLDYTGKTFTPVGGVNYTEDSWYDFREFCGNFLGNRHSINNVTIYNNSIDYFGLFGCLGLGGRVEQLTLGGQSSITTTAFTGGIVGVVKGNPNNYSTANVYDCHVGENVIISVHPDASGTGYEPVAFGGVVGQSDGRIECCTSKATISNNGITKTKQMGGIVGRMYNGEVDFCYFMGSVVGTNNVGDIIGEKTGGGILANYYHTSTRHGGVNGNDTEGAKWMGTVSFGEHVSGVFPEATYWDSDTPYFGVGKVVQMAMNYTPEAGYVSVNAEYFANGSIPLTLVVNYYQFTMPDDDVTITGSATLKRDIGYSNWVSIDIPSQTYTGDPLTPMVTVTDNKSGTPITLVENTDYTVTLPDGGCINWGQHTITITGIGNFGGQTTATFTIDLPGGGSGTEEDPYIILTTDELDALAGSVNGGDNKNGEHFRLLVDLDYSGKTYTPIGTMSSRFQGTFDGHGHSIKSVIINQPDQDRQALFAVIGNNGTVKNLVLGTGSAITGGYYIGGIAGLCSGTITSCSVSEGVSITGNQEVGGIAGRMVGSLSECVNKALVSGSSMVGGIAGSCYESTLSNNLNLGAVDINAMYKGGIVGYIFGSTLSNNYYAGNCTVGGIDGGDVAGQAMRGYTIEAYAPLSISLEGSIGLLYEGKAYAGNGQNVVVSLNSSPTPQCYILSAGTLVDNGDDTYTITMPNCNITISGNIVGFYGTYYEIPCNGGTTATVIYDASYATLDYVGIEDFECGGVQYTVTAIAASAFDGLDNLEGIDCHSNISSIGANAFRNCTGLNYFGFYHTDTPPTVGGGAFEGLRIDTLMIVVPYCSQYDFGVHPVFGQFGEITGDGNCEYNFTNDNGNGDKLWSNPDNWAEDEVPGEGAQVAIFSDCEIDESVTIGSVTIGYYYDESYNLYERLTLKNGATLTATDFIYTTGDERNFVIEDGAQVVHPNTGTKATVKKAVSGYVGEKDNYYLIGYPFVGSGSASDMTHLLDNDYDLYYYDEPTHYWMNQEHAANGFTELEAAKGYLYANSSDVTLGLKGTLNKATETVNVPLSYTDDIDLAGFNLVGNPFAHNVTTFVGANVADEVYRMNDTKDNLIVSEVSAMVPLLPGEGFFVKATGDNASITFNPGRSRGEAEQRGHIALELSENGIVVDRFILKDGGTPMEKFSLSERSTRIYATRDRQDWAVLPMEGNEQPLNFKAAKNGTYTLSVSGSPNAPLSTLNYLHLIDNLTGADIDLLPSLRGRNDRSNPEGLTDRKGGDPAGSYSFTGKTTDYASRFKLVFSANENNHGNENFAYVNNGQIILTGVDVCDASLQIIDMVGRVILTQTVTPHSSLLTPNSPGVYVLKLTNGDKVRTQKILVRQ